MGRRELSLLVLLALLCGLFVVTNRNFRRVSQKAGESKAVTILKPEAAAPVRPAGSTDAPVAPWLIEFVQPADAAELDAALPAPTDRIRYVRVNTAWIES